MFFSWSSTLHLQWLPVPQWGLPLGFRTTGVKGNPCLICNTQTHETASSNVLLGPWIQSPRSLGKWSIKACHVSIKLLSFSFILTLNLYIVKVSPTPLFYIRRFSWLELVDTHFLLRKSLWLHMSRTYLFLSNSKSDAFKFKLSFYY